MNCKGIFFLVGFGFIGLGTVYLVSPDTAWNWRERNTKARQIVSPERPPDWDRSAKQAGWGFIILGVMIVVIAGLVG